MKIIKKIKAQKNWSQENRNNGKFIGYVPTMGFLHEGHLSLVRKSVDISDVTVVSIFVNPGQFGPGEDFKDYPRDEERDIKLLEEEGVDAVFIPDESEMYPPGFKTYVEVEGLSRKYCGETRTIHFRGVTTVLIKLFNIVKPDVAIFGEKDYQQFIIVRRMCRDLNLDVRIETSPTVREKDGLAMSSRNRYLNSEERNSARFLYKSLLLAVRMVKEGEREVDTIIDEMKDLIESKEHADIEYIEFVDPETLEKVDKIRDNVRVLLAVRVGKARLIDNIGIEP